MAQGDETGLADGTERFAVAKTFAAMMDQCQWASPHDIRRLQEALLEKTLRQAREHVPFYGDRLDCLFDDIGQIDLSRWKDVPPLERGDLLDNFDALTSTSIDPSHGTAFESRSSGSTGQPVRVLRTPYSSIAAFAGHVRGREWAGIDYSIHLAQIGHIYYGSARYPGVDVNQSWAPFWRGDIRCGTWKKLDQTEPHDIQLKWLNEQGRCYLSSMPSNVRELARCVARQPELKPDIAAVLTVSEIVSEELREEVRDHLGCEIWDSYSSEEFGSIAYQCPEAGGYHVADESVFVEVVDEKTGEECTPGQSGQVLVTTLHNQAMPLIRYRLGDYATPGGKCSCGRGLTHLLRIDGRERQLFRFSDGTSIMPALATADFLNHLQARQWQVAQVAPDVIEIRFVTDATEAHQNRDAFVMEADRRLGRKLQYDFRQVDEITRPKSGKLLDFVREYDD